MKTDLRILLSTCPNREEAERIAHRLVELGLAACGNIVPGVHSIFRWQGEIVTENEVLLLLKTNAALAAEAEACLSAMHSYQTPEILVLDIAGGAEPYLAWLAASLKQDR